MKHYIGIDLGGTNIKVGLVNELGEILLKKSVKTRAERSGEAIVADMANLSLDVIREAGLRESDVVSIGIGSPGVPNNKTGELVIAYNLPFHHMPMRLEMHKVTSLPVYIDNDANVAALAESAFGGARDSYCSVAVTLGTGVGGGVVINNRIYSGFNNSGCEIGHIVIAAGGEQCTCGRKGCFEAYASATALIRDTERAALANPDSILSTMVAANGGQASGRTSFEAKRRGDAAAAGVVDKYIDMLAEGLANVINGYMPEVIVIGGGVCNEGDDLMVPLIEKTYSKAKSFLVEGVERPQIRVAQMGNDAGIVGAAMMGRASFEDGLAG
ncbi:MAG: ROK family protein [Eubacteriales bacterium]|nr:ROK family protein [Eubacteriales bacterium]